MDQQKGKRIWQAAIVENKPCCAEAAARKTKHLVINGHPIGLSHLDEIMIDVRGMALQTDAEIAKVLLKELRIFNYVPSSASPEYEAALLDEYRRRR